MVVQRTGFSFVQQPTLAKLLCSRCKKYLSYPPIYRHVTEGPVCGRCTTDKTENLVHDELYECAIEYQKFPCIFYESGCLENLFPRDVAEHEKRCIYMKFNCPTRVYNNCTWEGTTGNLLEHFESKHPTFILRECQFEVDFVNNHKENYIMPFAEDLYVVTREADSKEKTFAIVVSNIGSNHNAGKYIYTLTLESGNRAYKYSLSQDVGNRLQLQGSIVREMLRDPVIIIANISIEEAPVDMPASGDPIMDEDTSNPLVDLEQLENLECPVCFHYLVPPIYQCERGHSICSPCKEQRSECPTCRGAFNQTQNYVLERVINNMFYPCRHAGCKFATKAKDIKQHEASCLFGPFKCPLQEYENCAEIFTVAQLFDHIKNKHYESLIELDTISVPIISNLGEDFIEAYIIKHYALLFKLCFKYVQTEEVFYWSLQLIGPPEESSKYKYELEIIDNNGKNNRLYIKTNCAPLAEGEKTFENEEHFVYFQNDQLAKFVKNQLTYRIRIIRENQGEN